MVEGEKIDVDMMDDVNEFKALSIEEKGGNTNLIPRIGRKARYTSVIPNEGPTVKGKDKFDLWKKAHPTTTLQQRSVPISQSGMACIRKMITSPIEIVLVYF